MARFASSVASSNEPRVPRCVRLSLLCLSWTQLGAAFVVVRGRPLARAGPSSGGCRWSDEAAVAILGSSRSFSPQRCPRASVAVAAACATTVLQDARHSSARESAVWEATSAARHEDDDEHRFRQLCHEAGVVPGDLLRLDTSSTSTSSSPSPTDRFIESSSDEEETRTTAFDRVVRGVYLNRGVRTGDVIVSIPLRSCLRDDEPPLWYDCAATSLTEPQDDDEDGETRPCMIAGSYNPSDWATRLAASLIQEQLSRQVLRRGHEPDDETRVTDLWLQLLPDPDWLRASLPVHWPAPVLRTACCASLELAVDAAFFSRAQAAQDLEDALLRSRSSPWGAVLRDDTTPEQLRRMCENALDVVQTRACRVSVDLSSAPVGDLDVAQQTVARDVATPLRLLAPVFDMINHSKRPNAEFFVRYGDDDGTPGGGHLVVRATRDLRPGDQVLIDYGASTRPAYRCLASYGFVPAQREDEDEGGAFVTEDDGDDDDVAEVYIDGSRYEVTRTTVPEDIVLAMAASPTSCAFVGTGLTRSEAESVRLTPDIAIRLATRLSDVAYQLLLNPLDFADDDGSDDGNDDEGAELPHDVLSARLAASLRWNQHRILLACALGLRDWAVRGSSG